MRPGFESPWGRHLNQQVTSSRQALYGICTESLAGISEANVFSKHCFEEIFMPADDVTSTDAAETPRPSCKHILVPGHAHCLSCGEQLLHAGLERTRWQRFVAWVEWVADLLGYNSI
jgi:hypothetical protein